MSKPKPPRLPDAIQDLLDSSGYAWHWEAGKKHHKLFIEAQMVSVVSYGSQHNQFNGRRKDFMATTIKKAVKQLRSQGVPSTLPPAPLKPPPLPPSTTITPQETSMTTLAELKQTWDEDLDAKIQQERHQAQQEAPEAATTQKKEKTMSFDKTEPRKLKVLLDRFGSYTKLAEHWHINHGTVRNMFEDNSARWIYELYADIYLKYQDLKQQVKTSQGGQVQSISKELVQAGSVSMRPGGIHLKTPQLTAPVEVEAAPISSPRSSQQQQLVDTVLRAPLLMQGLVLGLDRALKAGRVAQWQASAHQLVDLLALEGTSDHEDQ